MYGVLSPGEHSLGIDSSLVKDLVRGRIQELHDEVGECGLGWRVCHCHRSVVVDRPLGFLILYLLDVAHGKRLHGAALLASDQNFDMLLFDFFSVKH